MEVIRLFTHAMRRVPALAARGLAPVLLLAAQGLAVPPALAGALPDGFDGLRWEAPVAQLPDAKKLAETPLYACYRSGDGAATVATAPVSNLRLCFANDRLYFVQMEFGGRDAYEALLAHGKSSWGEGRSAQRFTETQVWGGGDEAVYVELEYSREDNRGTLAFVFLPVFRETQEAGRRARARATPGAGF